MGKPCAKSKTPAKSAERWANSIAHLAGVLGVTRQTIHNWQKLDGCPKARSNGKYVVSEWATFGREVSTAAAVQPESKIGLEARKLKAQCEKLEFWLAVDRGEFTRNDIVADDVRRLVAEGILVLRDELETKMPPAIRKKTRPAIDRVCERLHRGADAIAAKFPNPES